ncbi:tRNA pseudouridine(13) synthase TruD [Helicobacter bizzozeronii]|uniref:tRNA pseudouridine(13) synthase TruD n=2 Tax=Helicobacter bizzozeronii TaxID=56877 RepID=UPI000CF0DE9D|nr:tRNA pseudouridine(13) synthase TruD [Helicobacter bizzozeronii]
MNASRFFASGHAPITFSFHKCPRDFVVQEEPLYAFYGHGDHLIVQVRKKNKSTWEMLSLLSQMLGCDVSIFGYAGLKDKHTMALQYVSMPKSYETLLDQHTPILAEQGITILRSTTHPHKLNLGHLKGNHFLVRLKKLDPINAQRISQVLLFLQAYGFPNYLGVQCSESLGEGFKHGNASSKKIDRVLLSNQQSCLFNQWLGARMRLNSLVQVLSPKEITQEFIGLSVKQAQILKAQQHYFKLLNGDVLCHYPSFRRCFYHYDQDLGHDVERLYTHRLAPTGLLPGHKVLLAKDFAGSFEEPYSNLIDIQGDRRYALVFPTDVSFNYNTQKAQGELRFFLPKGAYATTFLEELAGKELFGLELPTPPKTPALP